MSGDWKGNYMPRTKNKIHITSGQTFPKGSLKSEKREKITRKLKIKQQKGGTLASQIKRMQTTKGYKGDAKKMIK